MVLARNPQLRIRDRAPGDRQALEAMTLETHRRDGYPKYLPEDLGSFIIDTDALGARAAISDGQVVGHVALHRHGAPQAVELAVSATGLDEDSIAAIAPKTRLLRPGTREHRMCLPAGGHSREIGRPPNSGTGKRQSFVSELTYGNLLMVAPRSDG